MNMDLQRAVVEAREKALSLKVERDESFVAWEVAKAPLITALREAMEAQTRAETALRDAALVEYELTKESDGSGGNKHPMPGVEIKVSPTPVYEAEPALEWAIEHKQAVIPASLNTKEFEAIVKAMAEKPDFVTMTEVAKANLDSDMAKALEGVGE